MCCLNNQDTRVKANKSHRKCHTTVCRYWNCYPNGRRNGSITIWFKTSYTLISSKQKDILTTFDFIHPMMAKDLRDEKQSGKVKTKISNLAHSYVNSYKPTLHALKKTRILKRLANNTDIVFYVQMRLVE